MEGVASIRSKGSRRKSWSTPKHRVPDCQGLLDVLERSLAEIPSDVSIQLRELLKLIEGPARGPLIAGYLHKMPDVYEEYVLSSQQPSSVLAAASFLCIVAEFEGHESGYNINLCLQRLIEFFVSTSDEACRDLATYLTRVQKMTSDSSREEWLYSLSLAVIALDGSVIQHSLERATVAVDRETRERPSSVLVSEINHQWKFLLSRIWGGASDLESIARRMYGVLQRRY